MTNASTMKKPPPPRAPRVFDAAAAPADPALLERLRQLQSRYATADAQSLIAAAVQTEFPGQACVVSSFGSESVVLLHLVSKVDPSVPILFLNTGKLFGETLRYRDRLQDQLGLTDIRSLRPHPDDEKKIDPDGVLWAKDPDSCCHFRKTLPLQRAIGAFQAELTGRKRFQTKARAGLAPVELNGRRFVFNPLASWGLEELAAYIVQHDLPRHPLVADGFLSIGCMPCTDRVKPGEDYRSGRWSGQDKEECGIHENAEGDGI